MGGDGDAASHVADNSGSVFSLAAGFPEVTAHDGAGVKGVEKSSAGKLRDAAHMAFRQHFIGHGRVRDVRHAGAKTAVFSPKPVNLLGDVVSDEGAQIAGVVAFTAGGEDLTHIGIHIIYAGDAGGEQAAAAHDNVNVLQADFLFSKGPDDSLRAHLVLVHYVGKAG